MNRKQISTALALIIAGSLTILAQTPGFNNVKPSTTGVPGEEVRVMKLDPAGNLWIAGRFYFWEEVGLAMLSADHVDHRRWVCYRRMESLVERTSPDSIGFH